MTEPKNIKRGRRILLADDNIALQGVVKRVAEQRGHVLVQATSGKTTVSAAIEHQPDVIVLDLEFPDADGRDVLAKLKGDPKTAHIPVVVWSGRTDHDSDSKISLDLGAEDYVEKNDAQLLLRKLDRILLRLDEDE